MERPAAQRSSGLPSYASRFIGRELDVRQLAVALERNRLVTLTGPAGSGKTRLALEVADRASRKRRDGAFFVDLAALGEAQLLPEAFAAALGIHQAQSKLVTETVVERLRGLDCLLVVDNCEHLIEACAAFIDHVVRSSPDLSVLATSRESLRVDGEMVWEVPPLPLPKSDSLKDVVRSEAARFFAEKARQAAPGFALSASNAVAVVAICRRLDGLPLALELAAARTRVLDVRSIEEQLDDRFRFLTGGFRSVPARQRTLRAAIDWSFDLLSKAERDLFVRLTVFAGSFDLAAAGEVCSGGAVVGDQVLNLLHALIGKSLVLLVESPRGPRYRLLDSFRAYGADRLRDEGELHAWRRRHCEYFVSMTDDEVSDGWIPRMRIEIDNLREALGWSRTADAALHLQLATRFGSFCRRAGYIGEGITWLKNARSLGVHDGALQTRAATTLGFLGWRSGDHLLAERCMDEVVRIHRASGNDAQLADALGDKAYVLAGTGRLDDVRSIVQEQELTARRSGQPRTLARALYCRGILESHGGSVAAARKHYAKSLELYEAEDGEAPDYAYNAMAWVLLMMREPGAASPMIAKSLAQRMRRSEDMAACLDACAECAYLEGDLMRAMRLNGAADAIRERAGAVPPSMAALSRERWVAHGERTLGRDARATWLDGARMSPQAAAAYALAGLSEGKASARPVDNPNGSLSRREIQIAEFVAAGLSNDETAAQLGLSRRTVEAHLDHIRDKLGVRSRVEVATWVAARSLPPPPSQS